MKDLNGRIVLVTGAARGMGKLYALTFAREGCRIVLTDVDRDELSKVESEMKATGIDVHAYEHDVTDYDKCVELAARVEKEVGPVDVLINNAGIVYPESMLSMSAGAFRRITDVNYLGTIWMMKAFVPSMVARKSGHVVNVGSQAAKMGMPLLSSYCGTKFGVVGATDSIRIELKRSGVHFTLVHPGYVTTGMFEGAKVPFVTSWLEPEDVVDAVLVAVKKNKAEVFVPHLLSWMVGFGRGLGMPRLADLLVLVMGAKGSTRNIQKDRGRPF